MKLEPIAVTGISALFPGSPDADGFWRDIQAGTDLMREVPETHWRVRDYFDPDPRAADRIYNKRGAFMPAVPFDPLAYGIPPNALPFIDCAQLLSLLVARRVLEQATGGRFPDINREGIGVILGVTGTTGLISHMAGRIERPRWEQALREHGFDEPTVKLIGDRISDKFAPWQENTFPGFLGNVIAGRIANRLDLGGINCIVDAACASSLAAVSMAVRELNAGDADTILVGGVDTLNVPLMYMAFARTGALSKSDDCRPFNEGADGTAMGEGIGMMALRRLADAERDGDRIFAVLRGLGSSSDGRSKSIYAPVPEGQARAIQRAYSSAGISPATVELIEAHGTGTAAGDAAEFRGLEMVFDPADPARRQWCALGSVKSQIGHTKGAAGIAGLFKAVMAVHHKVLPPTIKVNAPNPVFEIERSPFYLNAHARPWVRGIDHPRRAGVSSFGFGGTNFHIVVEEHQSNGPRPGKVRATPSELFLFSADTTQSLAESCGHALDGIQEGVAEFHRLARASQLAYDGSRPARLAVVAPDLAGLRARLSRAEAALVAQPGSEIRDPEGIYHATGAEPGQVAFLFPGQGSQYVGMCADLAMGLDRVRAVWDRASDLPLEAGRRLHEVVFPRPAFDDAERQAQAETLTATQWAQPAIGACSVALLGLLRDLGLEASHVAGHSLGELTALYAADVLDLEGLLSSARRRGELIATASQSPGAMTAVLGPADRVKDLVARRHPGVTVANHNSPRQLVLSGPTVAIIAAERDLTSAGLRCKRLEVAAAFHSPLVAGAAGPFRDFLETLPVHAPRLPVLSNDTGAPYPADAGAVRDRLGQQLARPVRFAEIVESLAADGVRTFIEVGPGTVLTGLVGECLEGRPHLAVALDRKGQSGWTGLWHALGQLAVQGIPVNWEVLWREYALPAATPPPLSHAVMLCGANSNQPIPVAPATPVSEKKTTSTTPKPAPRPPFEPSPSEVTMHSTNGSPHANGKQLAPKQPPPAGDDLARWLGSFEGIVHETAAAHRAYQESAARTCQSFFGSVEQCLRQVCEAFGTPLHPTAPALRLSPTPAFDVRPVEPAPLREPAPLPRPPSPTVRPAPAANAPLAAPIVAGVRETILAVVSEKTGYPVELLELDMNMEADLGIDSIKRVEIFSGLEGRLPALAGVDQGRVFAVRTLADILDLLGEAPPVAPPQQEPISTTIDRSVVRAVPALASGFALPGLMQASPLVIVTGEGPDDPFELATADALADRLRGLGLAVAVSTAIPADARGVVFLGGLRVVDSVEQALAVNRSAFAAARAFAPRADFGGVFVTVQDTGGDFGLSGQDGVRAWLCGLPGLVKTAAAEWPAVGCRAVDVARGTRRPQEVAEVVFTELTNGTEMEAGLQADGTRWVPRCEHQTAVGAAPELILDDGDVVVVSGGGRGVTAACLLSLAKVRRLRLALLGRTTLSPEPECCHGIEGEAALCGSLIAAAGAAGEGLTLPVARRQASLIRAGREVEQALASLRAAGSEVKYLAVDVQDAAAMRKALAEIRREWGPVRGLIHAAGVLADRHIRDKTPEQFEHVFGTKVGGLRVLLEATVEDPLRLLCTFSSVAARLGNAGQCDYSMANEVLNRVAAAEARRRGPGCVVRSIAWSAWDGGMVTPALKEHFQARGVALLALDAGAAAFVRELDARNGPAVEVIIGPAGPGELLPTRPAPENFEVILDPRQHGFLQSHCVEGEQPVLPAVLVLEWFARAASMIGGAVEKWSCRDFEVLAGVQLGNFDRPQAFRVVRSPLEGSRRRLELWGDSRMHYSAVIEPASRTRPAFREPETGGPWPWSAEYAYGEGLLFHGPDFRVIRKLEWLSAAGACARLGGTEDRWGGGMWHTHPSVLDGGMQVALLWALHHQGARSLPSGFESFTDHAEEWEREVRCVLRVREKKRRQVVSDLLFTGTDGRLLGEMRGLCMTLLRSREGVAQ